MLTRLFALSLALTAAGPGLADDSASKVAVFELSGTITEKPAAQDDPFQMGAAESCTSLTRRMNKAASDPEVAAVVVLCESPSMGWAQSEEIHRAIAGIREAGKPVYAYDDMYTTAEYAMLSSATKMATSTEGSVLIPGLAGAQPYVRGLLDKLEVEPDFIALGDYKAAGEMFMRREPSEAAAENTKWLYDNLYASLLDAIAKGRGVDRAKAEEWIDEGVFSAKEAVADGVLDLATTRDELADLIEKNADADLTFDKGYQKPKQKTVDLSSPFGLLNFYAELLAGPSDRGSTKPSVAIVHVNGAIADGEPETSPLSLNSGGAYSGPIRRALDKAADDSTVKAVVLRVDSPGGSATASEVILQAAERVTKKKPLIVSMGNVAASGGYYVSMAGETIFVDEKTITGSIGVVSGKLATTEMWEKVGVNFEPILRGKNADLLTTLSTFSDEQEEEMKQYMRDVYGTFKGHVVDNRGDKLTKPIDELAGGRVYSGRQAIELGLADETGTIHDAIEAARQAAKLGEEFELRTIPRPKNFIETLMADLQPPKKDKNAPRLSLMTLAEPVLGVLDPAKAAAVREVLTQAEVLSHCRVGVVAPIYVRPQ